MDTRTPAEKAADSRAQQDAMRQAAAITARDAKATGATIEGREAGTADAIDTRRSAAERARRTPALVGPLTARLAVENAALEIEERAALALEEAEAEVGNDDLWFILTQVFKPDSLSRLLSQCRAAVVKCAADADAEKAAAKVVIPDDETAEQRRVRLAAAPKPVIPDDETAEARRIREGHEADAKRPAVTSKAKTGPVFTDPVYERVTRDVDGDGIADVADPAEGTLNRFLARAIVAATESDNRP